MCRVVNMREIEFCMKYDVCSRCPLNKKCEEDYNKHLKEKEKKQRQERKDRIKEKYTY